MHVVPKHNREPRRVVDFTDLNRISIRQMHLTVKPFDLACKIPSNSIMSQFDYWNGVKSMKRLLRNNVDIDGCINNSRFINAMLTYKNTPCRDLGMSPSKIVLGRNITDFFPDIVCDGLMNLSTLWREKLLHQEAALSTC